MLKVADEPGGKPPTKYEIVPVSCTKSALTLETALIVTEQVSAMPVQAPLQPAKPEPLVGVAVSVMTVFWAKDAVQVVPQSMPAGLLETVPVPNPVFVMLSANVGSEFVLKVAVTDFAASIVTEQVSAVPVQAPPQPAKLEPLAGAAFKVTLEPLLKLAEQVVPQSTPAGVLETAPVPVPFFVTLSAKVGIGFVLKVAVTDCTALMVTTHDPAPVQAPFQPAKLEPASGVAFSVTLEPLVKGAVQVAPQLIPAGVLETVPVPVPLFVTLKAKAVGACGLYMTLTIGFPPKLTFTDCEALLGRYVVFPTVTFGAFTV